MYRWFLALRYLLTRRINVLGVCGIAIGVWAMIVVVSIFSGYLRVVSEHVRSANADIAVFGLPEHATGSRLREQLLVEPNVAGVAPRLVHHGLLQKPGQRPPPLPLPGRGALQGGDGPFLNLIGLDPDAERDATGFHDWLLAPGADLRVPDPGQPFAAAGGEPVILLGEGRMRKEGLRVGDPIVLTSVRTEMAGERGARNISQQQTTFRIGGAFRTQHGAYDGHTALVARELLRELLGAPRDAVHELAIRLHDPALETASRERIARAARRALGIAERDPLPLVKTWRERERAFLGNIEHQRALMQIVMTVILVAAAFLMYAALSMMVSEKVSDIGILAALGGSPRGVMSVFLFCGLSVTAVGLLLGIASGCVSAIYLDAFNSWLRDTFGIELFSLKVYNLERVPYELDPIWILQVSGTALVVGSVLAALPAWRAARHDPLTSLRGA